jgi:general secretion pathway protein G
MKMNGTQKAGFTLIEVIVVIAVIAILAAILTPTLTRNIEDSKITRAKNEVQVLAAAVASLYKDVGRWPFTNAAGPLGGVSRVVGNSATVPTGTGPNAGAQADQWGTLAPTKPLADYLYYNNPDENSGATNQNEANQDYPTTGDFAWKGPYSDQGLFNDPWGRSYVINARYFPGNALVGTAGHRVFVLSAGPNMLWSSSFSDAVTRLTTPDDSVGDDDIGTILALNR